MWLRITWKRDMKINDYSEGIDVIKEEFLSLWKVFSVFWRGCENIFR